MRARICAAVAATALLGPGAAAALADERIEAAAPNRYTTPEVTMDQGERLTFLNRDVQMHDVTAVQNGSDGRPLFATPLLGQNEEALVEGSQYLTTGTYDFLCSVHPEMKGRLTVTSAGTPAQRPGTGGGGGGGGGGDTTAPDVSAALKTGTVRKARKDRALKVAVTVNEAARVAVRASLGGRRLAARSASLGAETAIVVLRLDRGDLRRLRRGRTLRVSVTATDAAGNDARTTVSRRLR